MKHVRYRVLPEVTTHIARLFEHEHLVLQHPEDSVAAWIAARRRFYMPEVRRVRSTKPLFLKARLQDVAELAGRLQKEVHLHEVLRRLLPRYRTRFTVPQYVAHGGNRAGFAWYLREYTEGMFAGDMESTLGYTAAFLQRCSPRRAANALLTLQRLTPAMRTPLHLQKHGAYIYGFDVDHYGAKQVSRRSLGARLREGARVLHAHEALLEREARVVAHGDLYPNNLLLTKKGALTIFDWEIVHINNHWFDVAFLYLLAWRNPRWQKAFLAHVSVPKHDTLFAVVVTALTIRFATHAQLVHETHPDKHSAVLAHRAHLQQLDSALATLRT